MHVYEASFFSSCNKLTSFYGNFKDDDAAEQFLKKKFGDKLLQISRVIYSKDIEV